MRLLNKESFLLKALSVHGNRYDYSKFIYKNSHEKSIIICYKHGEFSQTAHDHLSGRGCPSCKAEKFGENRRSNLDLFLKKAKDIHGDKYDYSKTEYIKGETKVDIICKKHGSFLQTPHTHLGGGGCPICKGEKTGDRFRSNTESFLKKAKLIHGNRYDYSKAIYKTQSEDICIICHNVDKNGNEHGEFWQKPKSHLRQNGCQKCSASFLESFVDDKLKIIDVLYERESNINGILGLQKADFFLPKQKMVIECQGMQHFYSVDFFGGDDGFMTRLDSDIRKKAICESNGISVFYLVDKISKNVRDYVTSKFGNLYNDLNLISKDQFNSKIKDIIWSVR